MRLLHANGTLIVHTHWDVVFVTNDRAVFRIPLNPVETYTTSEGVVPMPWCDHDILAVTPSGARAIVQTPWKLTPPSLHAIHAPTRTSRRIRTHSSLNHYDVTFVDETTALATSADRNVSSAGPALRQSVQRIGKGWGSAVGVAFGDLEGTMESIALPDPIEVAWPKKGSGIWAKLPAKPTLWHDRRVSSKSTFATNAFGHALSDPTVGLVITLDAGDPRQCRAYRVPSQFPEVPFTAVTTRAGFVVAHHGGRGAGGVNAFGFDGAHTGGHTFIGGTSNLVVHEDELFFLAALDTTASTFDIVRVALPRLEILERVPTSLPAVGLPGLATNDDASVFWAGNDDEVFAFARRDGWSARSVDLSEPPVAPPPPVEPPPAPAGPRRVVHPKFGEGTVVAQEGEGDEAKLEIAFAVGTKKLQAKFVRDVS